MKVTTLSTNSFSTYLNWRFENDRGTNMFPTLLPISYVGVDMFDNLSQRNLNMPNARTGKTKIISY